MTKRKKRNAVTLAFLLLALAALIGFYYWYSNSKKASEEAEDAEATINLVTADVTQINSLHYVRGDADLTLVKNEDTWISEAEPKRPMNQDYVQKMADTIAGIAAKRIIMEKPDHLADYGLEEPSAYLQATLADGSTITLQIGNVAGDLEGYYGLVNEDGIVYLLSSDTGVALKYDDTQMTEVAKGPAIAAENINHIKIEKREGEDYELKYSENGELDNSGSDLYDWEILKPYGEGYSADTTKVQEVLSGYASFSYLACVNYNTEDLKQYGLDDPTASIYVEYKVGEDPSEYKLEVGNSDEEGNYYVRVDESKAVYTMSEDTIDQMLTIDVFSLLNPYILIPAIDHVDRIEMKTGSATTVMNIKYAETTDKDGKKVSTGTYYLNDKKVEETDFKTLYNDMISLTYDKEISKEVTTEGTEPYATFSYHIFGEKEKTVTAAFLPYDDSFYIVEKDDGTHFFADKRAVDHIVAEVNSFTK